MNLRVRKASVTKQTATAPLLDDEETSHRDQKGNYLFSFPRRQSLIISFTFTMLLLGLIGGICTVYSLQKKILVLSSSRPCDADDEKPHRYVVPKNDPDGPPADLVVFGRRQKYAEVPKEFLRRVFVIGKGASHIARAFRHERWTVVEDERLVDTVHIYFRARGTRGKNIYTSLRPWQRYSRCIGSGSWESKDGFFAGFREYAKQNPKHELHFFAPTYRLEEESDRVEFKQHLDTGGGKDRPWLLKKADVNNGRGIEVLAPNSVALETAVDRAMNDTSNKYIVQSYICNELTWWGGNKFDLRMYWAVASVDPPIVLYHDGYVRVGAAKYDESDFTDEGDQNTAKHLTNHQFRTQDYQNVTASHLFERIQKHYQDNYEELATKRGIVDPVQHVRKQMKEAIGTLFAAFSDKFATLNSTELGPQNLFAVYGADFIVDNDLDVFFLEAQASPGFGETYDYRIDLFRTLYRPIPHIIEEISMKQQSDASQNILPLTTLGGYEVVYAGDWQYRYKGYKRPAQKKLCNAHN